MLPETAAMVNALLTLTLAIIGGLALCHNKKQAEKSLRNEKIERIYSIVESLTTSYFRIFSLCQDLSQYHREDIDKATRDSSFEVYKENAQLFRENNDTQALQAMAGELEILSRSYLKEDNCLKVMALQRMFVHSMMYTLYSSKIQRDMFWAEGFPAPMNVAKYTEELAQVLIGEIGFSDWSGAFAEELLVYSEDNFKSKVGLR